ncbi:MAG: PKD domain-containing protein, partial [Calditrichia bacterium]
NTLNGTETSVLETENINPNGEWIILFDAANGDFTTGDFACSNVEKLVVEAFCCDEPTCGNSEAFDGLTCRADTDPCPSVNVEILSISQSCANDGKRLVSLRATVNNAPTPTIYEWDFGDGENSSSEVFSTNPVDIAHEYDASDPNNLSYVAEFRIVFPQGCPPGQVTVNLPHCPSEPCPDQISTEVRDAQGNTVDIDQLACLDPGNYSVKVVQPSGSNLTFSWTINGTLQQGQTGSTLDVSVSAGQSLEINVAVVAPDCPPLADSVVLSGCQRCPDRARLAVLDPLGNTIDIDAEDCIPATKYSIVLVDPDAPEMQISWSVDGVLQPGFTTTEFSYDLSEGEVVEISVAVLIDGCPVLSDAITLVACDCPDETLGITVTDTAGNTGKVIVVNSGVYFLEATGGDLENVDLRWSAGATPLGNGTQATITFDGSAIGGCCFCEPRRPAPLLLLPANTDPNCPDRSASVTLRGCRTDTFLHRLLAVAIGNHIFRNYLGDGNGVWICARVVRQSVDPPNRGLGCNCSVGRASCSGHRHSDHHRHFTLLVVVLPPNMVR